MPERPKATSSAARPASVSKPRPRRGSTASSAARPASRTNGNGKRNGDAGDAGGTGGSGGAAQGKPASHRALRSQGQRTMHKLLEAAVEAFGRHGYHATRINDIVELAETSHGTFYLYFANKEDILRVLVTEALAEPAQYSPPISSTDGPLAWEDLREWVGHFSVRWARSAPLFRAWTELVMADRDLGARTRRTLTMASGSLGRMISRFGALDGLDPDVAGMAMFAMVDRFHSLRRIVGEPVSQEDLDALTTILHRALFAAERRPLAGAVRQTSAG